jgi:hypothetical protein
MKQSQTLCFFYMMLISLTGWGRVDFQKTKVMTLPSDMSTPLITEETKNKILPSSIQENESGHEVLAQMADNTASLWWSTTPLRNTGLGRAADAAEKKMNIQAAFEDENKIRHFFNFKVLAMQALARIEYKGWVNAIISYDIRGTKTEAEISDKISTGQDFIISQSVTTAESKSQIGLRWDW